MFCNHSLCQPNWKLEDTYFYSSYRHRLCNLAFFVLPDLTFCYSKRDQIWFQCFCFGLVRVRSGRPLVTTFPYISGHCYDSLTKSLSQTHCIVSNINTKFTQFRGKFKMLTFYVEHISVECMAFKPIFSMQSPDQT